MNYTVLVDIIVLSDWEGKNRYRVRNTLGQDVYFAVEGKSVGYVMSLCMVLEIRNPKWSCYHEY